ncbi:hypothetical protein CR205_11175 [Alteribacter lacisalsi]|uniref:Uncharacterized protein n=1 Tax=Alteribacter lacisalsi TaxID=2045244 RepID=A0A2W0HZ32_9BACI|nr:hypothetical protein [Alteribacter lacisalsi]PYZ99088.1 hypothetical protein CR205_11175 [Alteribacter lacisalsi]
MIKRMYQKLKSYFSRKKAEVKQKKQAGVIEEVNSLQARLKQITTGYDDQMNKRQAELNRLNHEYGKKFDEWKAVFHRVKMRTAPEVEADKLKANMEPLEERIQELNDELYQIGEYKRQDVLYLTDSIHGLKQAYTESQVEALARSADELLRIKADYQLKLQDFRKQYQQTGSLEADIQKHLQEQGINYRPEMSARVTDATDKHLNGFSFEIDTQMVNDILSGGAVEYELFKRVRKKQK